MAIKRFIDPTFHRLSTGEVVPEGIESNCYFYVNAWIVADPTCWECLTNCVWPYHLKATGYDRIADVYEFFIEGD